MINYYKTGLISISLALIIIFISSFIGYRGRKSQVLNFPFEMKFNKTPKGELGLEVHEIKVFLPEQHYSEENLKVLFKYLSKTYREPSQALHVEVYTDSFKLDQMIKTGGSYSCFDLDERKEVTCYDAVLWRQGNSIASDAGSYEFFTFRPVIKQAIDKIVVLNGTMFFRKKKLLDEYQHSFGAMTIRVIAYELDGVSPKGIYYTFEAQKKGTNIWKSFLTFRQDEYISPAQSQIHIINDKLAYVFMGWLYAVTINGGESWIYWNAENELQTWECCNSYLRFK